MHRMCAEAKFALFRFVFSVFACMFYVIYGVPTDLESWGILPVVRENFVYHLCFF